MSKFNQLFDKVEFYEKLSVFGNRSEFLHSIAKDYESVSNEDLVATMNSVKNSIQNWINTSAEAQPDVPSGLIKGLPPGLRGPYQVVRATNTFDAETLPKLYQALLQLSTVNNLGNMGGNAKSAWLNSVFPVLGTAMQTIKKQIDYVGAWANKFPIDKESPTEVASYQKETPSAPAVQPKAEQKSLNDQAKSLANLLTNKVNSLSNSVNRSADLKNINENVKSLQRYFRALQNKNDLQSYFARMEIVKSLQNAYSTLEYNDLDIVSALNSGQGVPETPDSKI
jgi:hypothetical protein